MLRKSGSQLVFCFELRIFIRLQVLIITVWMLCKIKKRRKGNGEYRPSEKEAMEMYFKFGHMRRAGFHTGTVQFEIVIERKKLKLNR